MDLSLKFSHHSHYKQCKNTTYADAKTDSMKVSSVPITDCKGGDLAAIRVQFFLHQFYYCKIHSQVTK